MNLYQIDTEIQALVDNADPVTGEVNAELLEQLQLSKEVKRENIIKYIKHLDNDDLVLDHEIKRLEGMRATAYNRREWLCKYLQRSMEIDGVNELNYVVHKAKIKKNPVKVVIDNPLNIPSEFVRIKTEEVVDKKLLKAVLEGGSAVPGAHLEQGTRLDII